jgi:hypothetical protein
MGYLTNYRQKLNFGLFETIRVLAISDPRLSTNILKELKNIKKLIGYQLFANKMCLSSVYYSKFGCCDS